MERGLAGYGKWARDGWMGAFWQIGRTSSHSAFLLDRRNIFARSERERETDREETNVLHRQPQGITRSYYSTFSDLHKSHEQD